MHRRDNPQEIPFALIDHAHGLIGRLAHHCEDGPLRRLGHCLVGPIHRCGKCGGEGRRVETISTFKFSGEAPPELGEDDAGVSACSQQHGTRQRLGDLAERTILKGAHGVGGRFERECQIRAGVAVRDRKDVYLVQVGALRRHPLGAGDERVHKPWAIDVADCHEPSSYYIRSGAAMPSSLRPRLSTVRVA